jgi:hypothetical protein
VIGEQGKKFASFQCSVFRKGRKKERTTEYVEYTECKEGLGAWNFFLFGTWNFSLGTSPP